MTNRLADAASVYLRQHADNPVEWWPWGEQAFEEARRREVPVLLSVGYASCHWCHVMAHESFEDAATAAQINDHFVPVKVDREERPDVDAVYMSATQSLTGQGGWPMTCFLTPAGEPFYAGTNFPPEPRSGLPSVRQVLTAITETWHRDRSEVTAAAGRIADALRQNMAPLPESPIDAPQLDRARDALLAQIDRANGGFGRAPKFPPSMAAEFLLRNHERTGSTAALDAVTLTLERMARGGIYDQLAGGFARYSVDATWHVPHFEKMLDDNALLLRLYAHHARLTGSALSRRIAGQTGDFLLRELRTEQGVFAASLDADTAGVEGLTYRWTLPDLRQVLGDDDAARALPLLGVDPDRPDPEGEVLRLLRDPEDTDWFATVRAGLLAARSRRPQPGLDGIVVLRSNGLAITALAEAGAVLDRQEWIAAANTAADALLDLHRVDGRWLRSSLDGAPGTGAATLADHACFAAGLLALYQATGEVDRLRNAVAVLDEMVTAFRAEDGGWFDVPAAGADPSGTRDPSGAGPAGGAPAILRPRDPTDGAAPSGASAAADALLTASALTGSSEFRAAAEQTLATVGTLVLRYPRSAGWHLAVAEALAAGPLQVAVSGPAGLDRDGLAAAARVHAPGGAVIEVGHPDAPGRPLLADRPGVHGRPAAYVCRGFVCDRPVTTVADLERALGG
jgi:uncharacterized protein YyaL (SSP411 family)